MDHTYLEVPIAGVHTIVDETSHLRDINDVAPTTASDVDVCNLT